MVRFGNVVGLYSELNIVPVNYHIIAECGYQLKKFNRRLKEKKKKKQRIRERAVSRMYNISLYNNNYGSGFPGLRATRRITTKHFPRAERKRNSRPRPRRTVSARRRRAAVNHDCPSYRVRDARANLLDRAIKTKSFMLCESFIQTNRAAQQYRALQCRQ